jgi:two-component system chemotaxis sensor kinase CheA
VLQLGDKAAADQVVNIVIVQADGRPFGLVVDNVNDTEEIVVKPLAKQLKGLTCFAGATIMGDGKVALILDVLGLAATAGAIADVRESMVLGDNARQAAAHDERQTLLVFGVGENRRLALPLEAVARLEEFRADQVEQSGSRRVVQYRGKILPLVRVEDHVAGGKVAKDWPNVLPVVVYTRNEQSVGLLVERIEDIVHEHVTLERRAHEPGILGSVVLQKRVTDMLDVEGIIKLAECNVDSSWAVA